MSESEDDSLNVSSDKFDPIKALYSPNVNLPVPDARIYDNISSFYSLKLAPDKKEEKQGSKKKSKEPLPSTSTVVRRFQPHQMPIHVPRKQLTSRNILTRMEKCTLGPLSLLRQWMENHTRIKVSTRNMNAVRGYCEAYVAAFDRHWNLALEDVREVWTRRKKKKVPAIGSGPSLASTPAAGRNVKVISSLKNEETLERHVPQLMMRGEHVVVISVMK